MVVKPVDLNQADCDRPIDLNVHAAAEHRGETILADGNRGFRRASMGSAEQRVDKRVDLTSGIQRKHRTARVGVNVRGNPTDRCVTSPKISCQAQMLIEIERRRTVPAIVALTAAAYAVGCGVAEV